MFPEDGLEVRPRSRRTKRETGGADSEAPTEPLVPGDEPPRGRILLVDDEDSIRFLVREMMRSEGHEVVTAASAEEALQRLREDRPYDAVVTDASLPGMSGCELVARLQAQQPGLRLLVMSGHLGESVEGLAGVPFLAKPFNVRQLSQRLREVLAGLER